MPQVLHDAPAAVLVIDLDRQQVVYANAAAIALTGERVGLPVDVDAWSDAAGLTDLGGQPMSETTLAAVARRAAACPWRASRWRCTTRPGAARRSARPSAGAGEGRLLWVTGFTLSTGTEYDGPQSRAMVVFQQLSGTELGDQRRLALLRDRAVIATEMSFTITDPRLPDDPLVWVNPSFTRLTGYRLDEVVGPQLPAAAGPQHRPGGDPADRRGPAPLRSRSPRSCSTTGATAPPSGTRCRSRR